ncbi:type I pantothenate kinase [bacterium endosymbiont of Pedicinus badii]|uniref:type I pantothenate kinase n=1 Tax=bacterium endosymbiont of Pedicinus badii TaxID=1719126 RepID=UPI0009BA54D7|nr:type I pantothenate kinase [bacterium endosymbiont of Pedicinus badii]OQM34048.1 hypothetical protein AOQ89_01670 [bacterium endosymbiont of Pedicinus badii]
MQDKLLQFFSYFQNVSNKKKFFELQNVHKKKLSKKEILFLKNINNQLSIQEVINIYLPLSNLLNFYINFNYLQKKYFNKIFKGIYKFSPYIIGICGSIAVGKSTTAKILKILLKRKIKNYRVEIITTDNFLYSNEFLKKKKLMKKKGFPETYKIKELVNCILKLKSGFPYIDTPFYSKMQYDIVPNKKIIIQKPNVLILEGINILYKYRLNNRINKISLSDLIDFSIYIDAPEKFLKNWYINRFIKICKNSFYNAASYFHKYSFLSKREIRQIASSIWNQTNRKNLRINILPNKENASLILKKKSDHNIENMRIKNR